MPNDQRNQPEDQIRKECINRLDQWRDWGVVVDYDDVHDLGKHCIRGNWVMRTEKGKRDVIALFRVDAVLWVYLIEAKAPDGTWKPDQKLYAKKFEGLENCIYEVVYEASQIDKTLERITRRTEKMLDDASNHLFPPILEEEF